MWSWFKNGKGLRLDNGYDFFLFFFFLSFFFLFICFPHSLFFQKICLNPDYDGAYDLKDGALQSGDWGVVVEDDGKESQPFRIEVKSGKKKGATWWYDAMGLMSYGGPVEEEVSFFCCC